jgi:hypothetical protein
MGTIDALPPSSTTYLWLEILVPRGRRLQAFGNMETAGEREKAQVGRLSEIKGALSPLAGLAGWGGRIRTSVWWNQNQRGSLAISTGILTKSRKWPLNASTG